MSMSEGAWRDTVEEQVRLSSWQDADNRGRHRWCRLRPARKNLGVAVLRSRAKSMSYMGDRWDVDESCAVDQ